MDEGTCWGNAVGAALTARQRPAVVPLSFAQSRLWFLDQLPGPSPVYNMAVALRLGGRLDADALGAALADVVGRHESLRTLFAAPDGIPQQLVMPAERADFGWQLVDATGWSAGRLGEAIEETARHSFDLATEIPLRGHSFSTSLTRSMCWWPRCTTSPGTAGRSAPLVRDLGEAYASRCAGQALGLGAFAGAVVCRLHAVAARAVWRSRRQPQPDSRAAGLLGGGPGRDGRAVGAAHRPALPAGR